jgi:hypothetical protein
MTGFEATMRHKRTTHTQALSSVHQVNLGYKLQPRLKFLDNKNVNQFEMVSSLEEVLDWLLGRKYARRDRTLLRAREEDDSFWVACCPYTFLPLRH